MGKTTLLKQMRMRYAYGFTLQDRIDSRNKILNNIFYATIIVIQEMEEKGRRLDLESELGLFMQRIKAKGQKCPPERYEHKSEICSVSVTSLRRILGPHSHHRVARLCWRRSIICGS